MNFLSSIEFGSEELEISLNNADLNGSNLNREECIGKAKVSLSSLMDQY